RLGVASAAACVGGPNTSDGIRPIEDCLAAADRYGHRATAAETDAVSGRGP
ncbi:MAG: hypothetical protein QOF55_1810, partial [Thermoleophilaceae bacterium]|nr:hypothetical protein [Thermoleophilaceae bacterium]